MKKVKSAVILAVVIIMQPAVSVAAGYELYFNNQRVSGPDADHYTWQQAQDNCQFNMQTKPNIAIRCVYEGQAFSERPAIQDGAGYELYFNGNRVSGPDAAGYTREQAQENCQWNVQTKRDLAIRCVYNGATFYDGQLGGSAANGGGSSNENNNPKPCTPGTSRNPFDEDACIIINPKNNGRPCNELGMEISSIEGNIEHAKNNARDPRYTEEQRRKLLSDINFYQQRLNQLKAELNNCSQ